MTERSDRQLLDALLEAMERIAAGIGRLEEVASRDVTSRHVLTKFRSDAAKRQARLRAKGVASRDITSPKVTLRNVTGDYRGKVVCRSSPEKQKQEINPLPPVTSSHVTKVFEHWRSTWNKPKAELTNDRERKITARLRDGYAVERLCDAISGSKLDPWPGRVDQSDVTLLMRPANVDKFADLWAKRPANGTNTPLWKKQGFGSAEEYAKHIESITLDPPLVSAGAKA